MSNTQQPEALNLEEFRAKVTRAAREPLLARIEELEAQLAAIGAGGVEAPAAPVSTYVEVRECPDCGHVGINDTDGSKAACNTCEWYGDSPREDKCPGCNRVGTMSAACPKCGSRTLLLAETHLLVAAPARSAEGVPAAVAVPDERAAFKAWLRVKPCGAAHDFAWEAWRARAALAATPAADAPMVDMTPPATSRDRWMYEQGRLAERDARTPGSVAAAAPVVLPEPDAYLYTSGNHRGVSLEWRGQSDMAEGTERHALYTEQQVRALLAAHAQADARDVELWIGIGKAIERAYMDLPDGTEISVYLEKDAGTVTLIDQDGNEYETFRVTTGFAGVLNEAIDAALTAQAKQGGAA